MSTETCEHNIVNPFHCTACEHKRVSANLAKMRSLYEAADIVRRIAKGDYCALNAEEHCQECLSCESKSYLKQSAIMPEPIEHADDCPYENARAWVSRNGKGE